MKRFYYTFLLMVAGVLTFNSAAQNYIPEKNDNRFTIQPQIPILVYSFPLKDVSVNDGPFKTAIEADTKWLMQLSPDRFLHRFHANAGLPAKGAIYGGWESMGVSGHTLGHYLSACAMLYATTGNEQIKQRVDYIVSELGKCQNARKTGYVGGIPDEDRLWNEIASGKINALGFDLNGLWVPWYTLHKLWAGLLDAYFYAGNEQAKDIVIKLTDWTCDKFKNLTEAQWQQMLVCEIGGMNEVIMSVYGITGEAKHLELANKFYQKAILDPLSQQKDELSGKHANTQIPKIIGAARAYEMTGIEKNQTIASFFWQTVVHNHSYVTGGNSEYEHFGNPGQLSGRLSASTTETCNTYNMLKLTRHLFSWNPEAAYMDYYERALYNHILASQNPETGMVCYFVPLAANSQKTFSSPDNDFWCCVGTGLENHVKYAENIYAQGENSLYVNLFIASELNWEEKGMHITQDTQFPDSNQSKITISCTTPVQTTFMIRYPSWATSGFSIKINGTIHNTSNIPGSYVSINRTWQDQDVIEIEMPFQLQKEALLGDTHKHAFLNGPLVLAGEIGDAQRNPVFLDNGEPLSEWMSLVSQTNPNIFQTNTGFPENIRLIPFYKKYKGIYSVYFDCFSPEEWEAVQEEYEKELEFQKELETLTVDYFRPNEQQQEIDHKFKGSGVNRGAHAGEKWCDAANGWFSFEMKTNAFKPHELMITYWGSDSGGRKFDILIDDEVIATEELSGKKPNEFMDVLYAIPYYLTAGKSKVTVKLRAYSNNVAGGIFGSRILLKKAFLDASVSDFIIAKEPSMKNHHFSRTPSGLTGTYGGRNWIDARNGNQATLSFNMACSRNKPMSLLFSFFGGEPDKRTFDILIDGNKIGTQVLYMNHPGEFFDVIFAIPENLTQGKDQITVTLQGVGNSVVGGFWYAYTLYPGEPSGVAEIKNDETFFSIQQKQSAITLSNVSGLFLSGILNIYNTSGFLVSNQTIDLQPSGSLHYELNPGFYIVDFTANSEKGKQVEKIISY